jgi:hypothetical protein
MPDQALDQRKCPQCGQPNGCAAVEGKERCWCFEVVMDPAVLARVPPEKKGACVCRECGVKKA